MTEHVLVFECRHGDKRIVMKDSREAWDYLRKSQDEDNRCSVEDLRATEYGGSYEEGEFWIEDGGSISRLPITELPSSEPTHSHFDVENLQWSDIAKAHRCKICGALVFEVTD